MPERPRTPTARAVATFLLATVALSGTACSPAYVARAGYEQARILWSRQPIEQLLNDPTLDSETRRQLELVLDVRRFAADEVGLRVAGSYASVAPVDGAVMHVVTAAERLRLKPHTWWFPIVGRVPYKGYFDEQRAQAEARRLEARDLDTRVVRAAAFSTLGWFDDPLFSSLLRLRPPALANLILHELLHSTHFVAGNATFSESFANFVGYRGAAAYYLARGDPSTAGAVESEWYAAIEFSAFLARELTDLEAAYASGITLDEREQRFAAMRERWQSAAASRLYPGFGAQAINNAVLLNLRVYHGNLAIFEALWEQHERDLPATVASIIKATSGRDDPFAAVERLLTAGQDPDSARSARTAPAGAAAQRQRSTPRSIVQYPARIPRT